jgi:murein DD-endopeptidase MepM/ murein hydrolase activator NlpD
MLLCPIENSALLKTDWVQMRPRITQTFGLNKGVYKQFGMDGHNGIDYGVPVGTPIYAAHDGKVKVKNDGKKGYGLHVKLRGKFNGRESVYGHLSKVAVKSGDYVSAGDLIGHSGNTGFSTGPHLHFGFRVLVKGAGDVFIWKVANYKNGFYGYIDPLPYMITYKGTSVSPTILSQN